MASLITGYEYDIFISYRQKDNKSDGWVTEFVENLKGELESTFKEDISVYFDINPHDGLLETHDVDASLKQKLKCLVFIPVISRTYCDPKSFAWNKEFIAFVEQAAGDPLGLKIKLPNGNVASRVLPVNIHELDAEDKELLESTMGGVPRGIDFIYRSSGVNRPLRSREDKPGENLNKTIYRDQINKVANAVKEIVHAIKKESENNSSAPELKTSRKESNGKRRKVRLFLLIISGTLLLASIIFIREIIQILSPKTIHIRNESIIEIGFINKTSDSTRILNPGMISYLVKFNLANRCNLMLLDENQFRKIYPPSHDEKNLPSKRIRVTFICGSSLLEDYILRYQIADNRDKSENGDELSFKEPSELLNFSGSLEKLLLIIEPSAKPNKYITDDWTSFEYYYRGELAWNVYDKLSGKRYFTYSVQNDSTFILPHLGLVKFHENEGNYNQAIQHINIVRRSIGKLSKPDSLRAEAFWNTLYGNRKAVIEDYKSLIACLPAQKEPYYELAEAYFDIRDIENAAINYRKALAIDPAFYLAINHYAYCLSHIGQHDSALYYGKKYVDLRPSDANAYDSYGDHLLTSGHLDSAKNIKLKGLSLDSLRDYIYESLAYIYVQKGKIKEAEKYIDKYISLQTTPERTCRGMADKAFLYYIRGDYKTALEICRKAISVYDSKDLVARNHVLHWTMARIYLETGELQLLAGEMREMEDIIEKNKIDEFNYNMIFKFHRDILVHQYIREGKISEAQEVINIFDREIYTKVKDWNYPFDIAYFNSEFGKLFLEINEPQIAMRRFQKALDYNKNYATAHFGMYLCLLNYSPEAAEGDKRIFDSLTFDADPEMKKLMSDQMIKMAIRGRSK